MDLGNFSENKLTKNELNFVSSFLVSFIHKMNSWEISFFIQNQLVDELVQKFTFTKKQKKTFQETLFKSNNFELPQQKVKKNPNLMKNISDTLKIATNLFSSSIDLKPKTDSVEKKAPEKTPSIVIGRHSSMTRNSVRSKTSVVLPTTDNDLEELIRPTSTRTRESSQLFTPKLQKVSGGSEIEEGERSNSIRSRGSSYIVPPKPQKTSFILEMEEGERSNSIRSRESSHNLTPKSQKTFSSDSKEGEIHSRSRTRGSSILPPKPQKSSIAKEEDPSTLSSVLPESPNNTNLNLEDLNKNDKDQNK